MPRFGHGWKANWAGLLFLAALSVQAGSADESTGQSELAASPRSSPARDATRPPSAELDLAPKVSANAAIASRGSLRLDLAAPPGLQSSLPPEPPTPSFDSPESFTPGLIANPTASNEEVGTTPLKLDFPPVEVLPPPSPAEILAGKIHSTLDRFLSGGPARRPIGAGDWNAARKAIVAVYAERGYAPIWVDGAQWGVAAKSVLSRLAAAEEDGLYLTGTPIPSTDWTEAAPKAEALADVQLSAAVVAYAMQASGARIHPRALSKDVSASPDVADPGAALTSVASAGDPGAALAAFNPPQEGYRALRAQLNALRSEAATPTARFAPGPVLRLGMSDPRVPLIRSRFGLGSRDVGERSEIYDIRVASAVAAFQRVHGLPVNGALTEATATALSGGGDRNKRREQLVLANMEMWRWEPREMGATRVDVNVPDFSLTLVKNDAVVQRTRVIVGKPETPTPIFSNSIKYMLFNPAWRVPDSIVKKEMAPKYANDPSYFSRHGYKVSYVGDRLEVMQPPGEANALGRMLFLFPNEHAVYLHDTPQRSLFSSAYRALSHGCVRVEDPARLAVGLMGGGARGWTETKIASLIGDKERTVPLPVPVPVHLEYFTEFVDENGTPREREDLYGLTEKVASALAILPRD
jgi:murein L,D-transpeptidase YcbB/YkuD